jgi:hypothetical protein
LLTVCNYFVHIIDQLDEEILPKEMANNQQQQPGSSGPADEHLTGGQQQHLPQQPSIPDSRAYAYSRQRVVPWIPGNKQAFEQTFKVVKPRWNDLWAGILVRSIFLCVHAG